MNATRLVVPIVSAEPTLERQVESARAAGADMVELRVDRIGDAAVVEQWLFGPRGLPCIVTVRDPAEGGAWRGTRRQRVDAILRLARARPEYIDLELATWRNSAESRAELATLMSAGRPRLILSVHDFERTPPDLDAVFGELAATPAEVIKGAFATEDARDALRIAEQGRRHRERRVIALAMGDAGVASRVLARKLGGFGAYASLSAESSSAPGQPTIGELRGVYRWESVGPATRVLGVIGWPVGHSMSPRVHNAAMAAAGIDDVYLPLPVAPEYAAFAEFMAAVDRSEWLDATGMSVTLPHKEHAARWLEERGGDMSSAVRAIGAVNTLATERPVRGPAATGLERAAAAAASGGWSGHNTDVDGVLTALNSVEGMRRDWFAGRSADVLGAGGAARAAAQVLAAAGCAVTLYNRTHERAVRLARELRCSARPWEERSGGGGELLVNCTSVGQAPRVDESPMPPEGLRRWTTVFDMIYNPPMTRLLREAATRGCHTISGMEMFVGQAEAQHRLWHGSPAAPGVMRTALSG